MVIQPIEKFLSFVFPLSFVLLTDMSVPGLRFVADSTMTVRLMSTEQLVERELLRETELLGEICSSATLPNTNPT
jgi:hypothetical protein